jgi:hypothetical protein
MQARRAILAVLSAATLAAAQNATTAPAKHSTRAPVHESILNSDQERMTWEASQTWSIPVVHEANPAETQTVHIDQANQPSPTLPKLRREWLTPSDESPKMVSEK